MLSMKGPLDAIWFRLRHAGGTCRAWRGAVYGRMEPRSGQSLVRHSRVLSPAEDSCQIGLSAISVASKAICKGFESGNASRCKGDISDRKVIDYGDRRLDYLAARISAGSNFASPVLQEAARCLPSSCHKSNREAIRCPVARVRHCYKRGSNVRQALPDAGECFSDAQRIPDRTYLRAR